MQSMLDISQMTTSVKSQSIVVPNTAPQTEVHSKPTTAANKKRSSKHKDTTLASYFTGQSETFGHLSSIDRLAPLMFSPGEA